LNHFGTRCALVRFPGIFALTQVSPFVIPVMVAVNVACSHLERDLRCDLQHARGPR
jgi:hypothetical protein